MKNSLEVSRIKGIIENDRLSINEGFHTLILNDLTNLLSDFFELKNLPSIEIRRENEAINITVCATALRIKSVSFLPNEQ